MLMRIAAVAVLLLSLAAAPSGESTVVDLWPGKPPDDAGIPGAERFFQLQMNGKPYEVGGRTTKWLTNVTAPTLTIYPAPKEKNSGLSMIICPGGGYHNLGWDVEGEEIAAWLNGAGITGILLKYRCPRRTGDVKGEPPLGPLKDAQRAVSLVRSRAAEWNLDPKKIGMVGFSAGGHLVGATATNFEARAYEALDDVDKISCRPDFGVMLYSGYFRKDGGLSPTIKTPAGIPPLFIAHASDDAISDSEHSVTMYTAMKKAGAAVELHIYATGGHGWGVRRVGHPCETWSDRCLEWLRKSGLLP
jgi:acetyl esterase/lipase